MKSQDRMQRGYLSRQEILSAFDMTIKKSPTDKGMSNTQISDILAPIAKNSNGDFNYK